MALHLPTLLCTSIATMAMSALLMTMFGRTQHVYRGFWWWVSAQWLGTVGLALQAFHDPHPAVLPLSNLLLLQWPITTLQGVRSFHLRHEIRIPALADRLLLAGAFLAWAVSWAGGGSLALRVTAFAAGACVLYLYSAMLTATLHDFPRSAALKALVTVQAITAALQGLHAVQASVDSQARQASDDMFLASALVAVTNALVMLYFAVLLTCERTAQKLYESQRQLRFLADTDTLTEVPNRRHFYELATKALALSAPGRASIVMFDIDHFKQFNKLFGHAEGDEALREVARCTRETLRSRDVVGRIGGDEFALLLLETSLDEARSVAGRVAARLDLAQAARPNMPLSLSVGVVTAREGENIADGLRRADQALFEAKRQVRSRAVADAADADNRPVFGESCPADLGAR